jgi:hypothetical protein
MMDTQKKSIANMMRGLHHDIFFNQIIFVTNHKPMFWKDQHSTTFGTGISGHFRGMEHRVGRTHVIRQSGNERCSKRIAAAGASTSSS